MVAVEVGTMVAEAGIIAAVVAAQAGRLEAQQGW